MKSVVRKFLLATLIAAFICNISLPAASPPPPDPYQQRFEKMAGSELVRLLPAKETRARAFYELMRRAIAGDDLRYLGKDRGFSLFVRDYAAPELTICPQRKNVPPLYLIAHNSSYRATLPWNFWGEEPFEAPRPFELFPPLKNYHQAPPDKQHRQLQVFTKDGKRLDVIAADRFSPANLADLTGDGVLEYVSVASFGLDGSEPEVLRVQTVEEESRCLLNLLINWDANEWSYRLADTDGDGSKDLEIGPVSGDGILPRAVFRWDKKAGAFRGPDTTEHDHFRVLKNDWELFPELRQLAASGLTFPKEPVEKTPPPTKPEAQRPASDAEETRLFPDRLPADFWQREARDAALAFAEANRTANHRNEYRIALEDRDGAMPPQAGTLALTEGEQGCFGATGREWFLSFRPGDSYLITAKALGASNIGGAKGVELHWQPLPEADARRIAAVVWWLDRLRTFPAEPPEAVFSTLQKDRWLRLRDGGGTLLLQDQATSMGRKWDGAFTRRLHLDATAWLLSETLAQIGRHDSPPASVSGAAAARILAAWSPDEARVSHALATAAVQALSHTDAPTTARLREIGGRIPYDERPPARDEETIAQDLRELTKAISDENLREFETEFSTPKRSEPRWSAQEFAANFAKRQALLAEKTEARIRKLDTGAALLRSAIASALSEK